MKTVWLYNKGRSRLIVFCNGWGMDENPFRSIQSQDYDVLMLYDYLDLDCPLNIETLFNDYKEVVLIGWSMGVWAGQHLFDKYAGRLSRAIAINGTLAPIDEQFGIPRNIFEQTHIAYGQETSLKFYKRMCRDKTSLSRFIANQPQRSLESRSRELGSLLAYADSIPAEHSIYTEVIVADKDFVIPTKNQLHFWRHKKVHYVDGYHFLFYYWHSWDELVENPAAT